MIEQIIEILKSPTNSNTLLYFYSSIAQSMAALIAITGVFAVFTFQNINNKISETLSKIRKEYKRQLVIEKNNYLSLENSKINGSKVKALIKIIDKRLQFIDVWLEKDTLHNLIYSYANKHPDEKKIYSAGFIDYYTHLTNLTEHKKTTLMNTLICIFLMITIFVGSLFVLNYQNIIFCNSLGGFIDEGVLLCTLITLSLTFLYIRKALQGERSEIINNNLINTKENKKIVQEIMQLKTKKINKLIEREKNITSRNLAKILKREKNKVSCSFLFRNVMNSYVGSYLTNRWSLLTLFFLIVGFCGFLFKSYKS
ncbi:hypothetical protein ACFL49_01005 [Candidatus Omnitrophota bacterium]